MIEDLDGEYVLWEEVIPYLYQHAEYSAPPLQAVTVPDEQTWEELCMQNPELTIGDAIIRAASWNACRNAMLAAPQPSNNPDQVGSDDAVEMLTNVLRNAPMVPSDNQGKPRKAGGNG